MNAEMKLRLILIFLIESYNIFINTLIDAIYYFKQKKY